MYWAGLLPSASPPVLAFPFHINCTVGASGLTPPGLEVLRAAFATAALNALSAANLNIGGRLNVSAVIDRVIRRMTGTGVRRLQVGTPTLVTVRGTLLVAPASSAVGGAGWATGVTNAVTAGQLGSSALGPRVVNALSATAAVVPAIEGAAAWSEGASSVASAFGAPAVTVELPSSLASTESTGRFATPASGAAAGGSNPGGAIVAVLIVGAVLVVMFKLRTEGRFAGRRMKHLATLGGMWPLHPRVAEHVRTTRGMKYSRGPRGMAEFLGLVRGPQLTSGPAEVQVEVVRPTPGPRMGGQAPMKVRTLTIGTRMPNGQVGTGV
jgi:hypothetical protein